MQKPGLEFRMLNSSQTLGSVSNSVKVRFRTLKCTLMYN